MLRTVIDPELGRRHRLARHGPGGLGRGRRRRDGRHQAHHRWMPAAGRHQARGPGTRRAPPRRHRRADRLGRDELRGALRGDEQGALGTPASTRRPPRSLPPCQVLAIGSGQGWRGQELGHGQPRDGARRARPHRRCARRRHLGLLGAATARHDRPHGGRAGARLRQAEDHPQQQAGGRRPVEGGVDGLPRRGVDRADVARSDAHQGRRAVPRRRGVGRARLPLDRHAARHRRRADGPRPDAAAHVDGDRHHAGDRGAEGRAACGRHGTAVVPAGGGRDREHERVHLRPRRDVRAVRLGRWCRAGGRHRRPAAGPGAARADWSPPATTPASRCRRPV